MSRVNAVNVAEFIDQQKVSAFQIRVLLLCGLVAMMDGFDVMALGYVAPVLSKAWHLRPGALKDVFASGLFGMMVGALIFGPLADKMGRKIVLILSTAAFSLFTLLTITSDSLTNLFWWRFLAGLGLGGAMPNALALTSEYSPRRKRASMTMIMFWGFSLGSGVGGFIAAWLIPHLGWKSTFWVGGLFPILLLPVLIFALPESIRLLALKGTEDNRIRDIFRRINPKLMFGPETIFIAHEERLHGFTVRHLFRERRGVGTLLLWGMYFMNLLNLYFLANWLPTVINNAGVSAARAAAIASLLQFAGTLGNFSFGRVLDRVSPFHVLTGGFVMAGLFIASIGFSGSSVGLIIFTVFGTGFFILGSQAGINAMTTAYYPTAIRSTGVGWALGIGRIGSIVGPWVGGLLLSFQWQTSSLFLTAGVPAVLAAGAAYLMTHRRPGQSEPTST